MQRQLLFGQLLLRNRRRLGRKTEQADAAGRSGDADGFFQNRRMADRIDDQRGTAFDAEPDERIGERLAASIDYFISTAQVRQLQTLVQAVGDDSAHAIHALEYFHHGQSYRTGTIHQCYIVGEHPGARQHIGGDSIGLNDGGAGLGNVFRDDIGIGRRHADRFTEAAIAVHAINLELIADIRASHRAGVAVAAAHHWIDRDQLADAGAVNILADCIDVADKFMADHTWIDGKWIHAMVDVQVGTANAGIAHAYAYLTGLRHR